MVWMTKGSGRTCRRRYLGLFFAALCGLGTAPQAVSAQGLDLCGCEGLPSRGAFVSSDSATFDQTGATQLDTNCGVTIGNLGSMIRIEFQVPEDGVLVFDSFVASNDDGTSCGTRNAAIVFQRPQSNAPVRILVKGDLTLASGDVIYVGGAAGSKGTAQLAGVGGEPGVGGFAGGEAAFLTGNLASLGGTGIGPGGGFGGDPSDPNAPVLASGGTFFGVEDLRPMIGGSGGGGGYSLPSTGCAGGGGGGGGGALQIVANGEIRIDGNIKADGGASGQPGGSGCGGGAGGSGGSILLIADTISGAGTLSADAGASTGGALVAASEGRVRMEAVTNTFSGTANRPVAIRVAAPGPAVAATTPTVVITHVAGALTPQPPEYPQGFNREIDMIVSQPGVVTFSFETREVPSGTDLAVAVKPTVGGDPIDGRVTLAACGGGVCTAEVGIPLEPGAYIAEARATFEVPAVP